MYNTTIWYYPEYGSTRINDDKLIENVTKISLQTINIENIQAQMSKNRDTFVINVNSNLEIIKEEWIEILDRIYCIYKTHKQFSKHVQSNTIKIILLYCNVFSLNEWKMFRHNPLKHPIELHFFSCSLASLDETILGRSECNRIHATNEQYNWHQNWWLESAKTVCKFIRKDFSKDWKDLSKIIHEWLLFRVDYESAILYVFESVNIKSLKVQCEVLEHLLSLLSILSENRNRECTKSSIQATTRQHMFYILESCILTIHKAYHQELNKQY